MVQSDVPRGRTQSGKVNVKWYLQRLKASAINHHHPHNKNDTIRVVRGTTATQGQHIPRVFLRSPTKSFENESNKQKSCDTRRSSSINVTSATSLKSSRTTTNKISPSISEVNSSSYQSFKTNHIEKDEKQISSTSDRRSSSGTLLSTKQDIVPRPPSTPVDPRCDRAYSSTTNSIQRETCSLLGPKLCSDCIETKTRTDLSPERLPPNLIKQRLSALSIRRFVKNQENLTDDDLFKMVNNQQIQLNQRSPDEINSSIISDEEYFNRLSSSLNLNSDETPYYFKDLNDLSKKYQSNKYKRLLLSENPPPKSANPIFKESSFEKFDISHKYSYMKKASTIKPNLKTNISFFISPKKSEEFYNEHRYLNNYSPPLLLQSIQQSVRINSNPHLTIPSNLHHKNKTPKRSLIAHNQNILHV